MDKNHGRVLFDKGRVLLCPPSTLSKDSVHSIASVVSLGTETRQLKKTKNGEPSFAGYMNLVDAGDDGHWILPTPHGSTNATAMKNPRALAVEKRLPLHYIAASRFQLIAAANLLPDTFYSGQAAVLGSGPVAFGCVLELTRKKVDTIHVVSKHPEYTHSLLPWTHSMASCRKNMFDVVYDCTGDLSSALEIVKDGGVISVLGTPSEDYSFDLLAVHRRGITLLGMHELRPSAEDYLARFEQVCSWLSCAVKDNLLSQMCTYWPGEKAPELYERIGTHQRFGPFIMFQW
ncbi:zinc-binding dehydrogenase [Dickeya sp. CFBP 2040]|uniref:zinc-binding dehydrogenase n=1 Tax=Dickeya sp. CFBP 2040 TaxID=2718531 RepID=UPI001447260B|nr:zinc-binding dehydrogenase [Dickeya sp. CFBP 2040]NKI73937.1 zinc-binding dehydrogenase [Dickeya sp. CFBP 2040]